MSRFKIPGAGEWEKARRCRCVAWFGMEYETLIPQGLIRGE
jgi:hypothetical protein